MWWWSYKGILKTKAVGGGCRGNLSYWYEGIKKNPTLPKSFIVVKVTAILYNLFYNISSLIEEK